MARTLNAGVVSQGKTPGKYYDGQRTGLYLLIRDNGGKQWKQRLAIDGKRRDLGLGKPPQVSLESARITAMENKMAVRAGKDIFTERRRAKRQGVTFAELARERHGELEPTWHNPKHAQQWINTLQTYAFPKIGDMIVAEVDPLDIKAVLMQKIDGEPLWQFKPETARRLRQRMGDVFKCAMAAGIRDNDPVAMISAALPKQAKKAKPHRSLPYDRVADAITTIRASHARPQTRIALEWLILTATRSSETRLAVWGEIDRKARLWTIPASRMKAEREHRIPLSDWCMEILEVAAKFHESEPQAGDLIFCYSDTGKPLSDMVFTKLLKEQGIDSVAHGFRSSFRTWVQEQTDMRREVAEAALAHANPNKTEAAYARSDYLEKRRVLMQDWADYLGNKG